MRFDTYTKNQIDELLQNKSVSKCSSKNITYTAEFKIQAVNQYLHEGLTPGGIFKQAGFNVSIIGRDKPSWLIHDWLKIFKAQGADGLTIENRGRKIGSRNKILKIKANEPLTDAEKIKRLELEVLYLKKENDFLAALRAKKSE